MPHQTVKFRLVFTAKVSKELKQLPLPVQKQYDKAFQLMTSEGPSYRSLRTHRYQCKNADTWSSSASMALRFYWQYQGEKTILVMAIDSH